MVAGLAMAVGFLVGESAAPGGPAFPMPAVVTDSSPAAGGVAGEGESSRYPKHCDSDELQDKSCTAPGECVNACAFWCSESKSTCYRCCVAFSRSNTAFETCRPLCDDVWPDEE